jgi:4-amino-4-deoxy-L-arabinose transferase-like glycosyltransferase
MLISILFTLCVTGFGRLLYGRWMEGFDPMAKLGICGILGLGTTGLLTLFFGLLPGGLHWGIGIIGLIAFLGMAAIIKDKLWEEPLFSRKPQGLEWLFLAPIVLGSLMAAVAALAPSTALDWDTIAYHLAVPALWLKAGQIVPVPFIHHSNFPQSVDNLYIWGLTWGDQAGAKAFQVCFYLLGIATVYGLTRNRYSGKAGAWAAVTFATVPVVLWEAGTGYIDVAHGLFAAVGVILVGEILETLYGGGKLSPRSWPIAALCLGFAAGSKYTGLQVFIALALIYGVYTLAWGRGKGAKHVTAAIAVALVVCAPWYVKNELWAGNPVFPFFYEQFGGKNWSQFNADIYKRQQQSFGIPREGPVAGIGTLPFAVLGLGFQPGRYTDPNPVLVVPEKGQPTGAFGFAWQSTGGAILVAGMVWLSSGKVRRFEGLLLGWIGVSFLMWFVLSQQSRYAITFAPILAMLLGAGVARLRAGPILAGAAAVQACGTLYVQFQSQYVSEMQVVTGQVSREKYLSSYIPYEAFGWLNGHAKKVALYDEVFGYYLSIPYFWANPGHTTLIGYDKLNDGAQFVARLKEMGFSHLYLSTSYGSYSPQDRDELRAAVGLNGAPVPLPSDKAQAYKSNPEQKYKWLIADAAQRGLFGDKIDFHSGFVLQLK